MKKSIWLVVFTSSALSLGRYVGVAGQQQECFDHIDCKVGETCVNGACLECVSDEHCSGSGGRATKCFDGVCSECSKGSHCDSGYCNNSGECSNCESDSQCGYGRITGSGGFCIDGACVECQNDDHCGSGDLSKCYLGKCSECTADDHCDSGTYCVRGNCLQCFNDQHCQEAGNPYCAVGGTCAQCSENSHCHGYCNAEVAAGTCEPCSNSTQCADGESCNDYTDAGGNCYVQERVPGPYPMLVRATYGGFCQDRNMKYYDSIHKKTATADDCNVAASSQYHEGCTGYTYDSNNGVCFIHFDGGNENNLPEVTPPGYWREPVSAVSGGDGTKDLTCYSFIVPMDGSCRDGDDEPYDSLDFVLGKNATSITEAECHAKATKYFDVGCVGYVAGGADGHCSILFEKGELPSPTPDRFNSSGVVGGGGFPVRSVSSNKDKKYKCYPLGVNL